MRKVLSCAICSVLFAAFLPCIGYGATLAFIDAPAELTPGKQYILNVITPYADFATLVLTDKAGNQYTMIEDFPMSKGENAIPWDGSFVNHQTAPEGEYKLALKMHEGKLIETKVYVAPPVPLLYDFALSSYEVTNEPLTVTFKSNAVGLLMVDLIRYDQEGTVPVTYSGAVKGNNALKWNGLIDGERLEPGTYALVLSLHTSASGISEPKKVFFAVKEDEGAIAGDSHNGGVVAQGQSGATQMPSPLAMAIHRVALRPALGAFGIQFVRKAAEALAAEDPVEALGLSRPYSHYNEGTFWTMTPGELDDAAIWEIMMQPMIVVGKGNLAPSSHVYLMENPDGSGAKIAQIHGRTQGLNVISTEVNEYGYVLAEAFSNYDASFLPRTSYEKENAFTLKQGYIDASLLSFAQVDQEMAFLVDKLTQRMYVFLNGERVTELFISTGMIKDGNYAKETIAGEFMTIGKTGGFWSNGFYSDMGIRINGGTLIHEIPCTYGEDGKANYSASQPFLGVKRSAGCVRVQREKNPEGYNMKWIWDHIDAEKNYKVLIWSDQDRLDTPNPWRLAPIEMKANKGE